MTPQTLLLIAARSLVYKNLLILSTSLYKPAFYTIFNQKPKDLNVFFTCSQVIVFFIQKGDYGAQVM